MYAHKPLPFIRKKFNEIYRDDAKKIIEKLVARGYASPHKGRGISYAITHAGIEKIKELQELGIIPIIIYL
jgi:predicted transcriptional regulator